jgi:hypothetical protein
MAKALFHKSQRVFVKPVGTWALIEQVIPHWVKDVDEPLRVTYEVGLGREFQAAELISEQAMHNNDRHEDDDDMLLDNWRIDRKHAKWRGGGMGQTDANPGTYPVVVTDDGEWGGWRVPGGEYDRDPQRVEHQARMIVNTPDLLRLARKIAEFASERPEDFPDDMKPIAKRCASVLRYVYQLDVEEPTVAAE